MPPSFDVPSTRPSARRVSCGLALDELAFGANEQGVTAERSDPLRADADGSGRNVLQAVEIFARAIGRHRRVGLVVALAAAVNPRGQESARDTAGHLDGAAPRVGRIGHRRRAIAPVFREHLRANLDAPAIGCLIAGRRQPRSVIRTGRRINRAALIFGDRDVAIGREPFAAEGVRPASRPAAAEQRHSIGAETPRFGDRTAGQSVRTPGEDLDDAADRVGAVEVAAAAAQHLDAVDRRLRQLVPVDPAAERVVERHAVGEHQRPARTGAAQAAQRDALRRGIRHARRGAAEQREPRHQLERIVERHGRLRREIGCRDDRHGDRRIDARHVGPRRGDVDRFEKRRRMQSDRQRRTVRRHHLLDRREAGAPTPACRALPVKVTAKLEPAIGRRS